MSIFEEMTTEESDKIAKSYWVWNRWWNKYIGISKIDESKSRSIDVIGK